MLKLVFQAGFVIIVHIYGDWTTWISCTAGSKAAGNGSLPRVHICVTAAAASDVC